MGTIIIPSLFRGRGIFGASMKPLEVQDPPRFLAVPVLDLLKDHAAWMREHQPPAYWPYEGDPRTASVLAITIREILRASSLLRYATVATYVAAAHISIGVWMGSWRDSYDVLLFLSVLYGAYPIVQLACALLVKRAAVHQWNRQGGWWAVHPSRSEDSFVRNGAEEMERGGQMLKAQIERICLTDQQAEAFATLYYNYVESARRYKDALKIFLVEQGTRDILRATAELTREQRVALGRYVELREFLNDRQPACRSVPLSKLDQELPRLFPPN